MKRTTTERLAHLRDTYMKGQDIVKFAADLFNKERSECEYYVEPDPNVPFADAGCTLPDNKYLCCLVCCPLRKE